MAPISSRIDFGLPAGPVVFFPTMVQSPTIQRQLDPNHIGKKRRQEQKGEALLVDLGGKGRQKNSKKRKIVH